MCSKNTSQLILIFPFIPRTFPLISSRQDFSPWNILFSSPSPSIDKERIQSICKRHWKRYFRRHCLQFNVPPFPNIQYSIYWTPHGGCRVYMYSSTVLTLTAVCDLNKDLNKHLSAPRTPLGNSLTLLLTVFGLSMTVTGVAVLPPPHRRRRHLWANSPSNAQAVSVMLREMRTSPFPAL